MKTKAMGFTLVEMLVVIAIMGILVAMLYPNFESFILRARLKEVPSTVEVIRTAQRYYFLRTGAYLDWTDADAIADYTRIADPTDIQEALNIMIPPLVDAVCRYNVTYTENAGPPVQRQAFIEFTSNDGNDIYLGRYCIVDDTNISTPGTYEITAGTDWAPYLLYLE